MIAEGSIPRLKDTERLMKTLWGPKVKDNLEVFVQAVYPWETPNTPLAKFKGPRVWQLDELKRISDHIGNNYNLIRQGNQPLVYRSATASGRGPGKSALVAWINHWHMSCNLGATSIISANTESQLKTRTFAEIGRWNTLAINGYWFDKTTTNLKPHKWFSDLVKKARSIDPTYWYADGVLWDEDNPSAFAGAHNQNGMMVIFDEASGIPQPIWTVAEGFFTDVSPYRFMFAFSNPRNNNDAFYACFHEYRKYWHNRQIDSRDVEGLDRTVYDEIIEKYGEDSREARIEVYGQFPEQGANQFISRKVVAEAASRDIERIDDFAPLCMGVDPARYGDDIAAICFRRGRDARSIPSLKYNGLDNMQLANICADLIEKYKPEGVFIDAGAGSGVIDRLREMGYRVYEVNFGSESGDKHFADHRTELWARMREWLSGGMIANDKHLIEDLVGPTYEFTGREDKQKLESKEKMKKRKLASPDNADALAVTFHCKISRTDLAGSHKQKRRLKAKGLDYNPLG